MLVGSELTPRRNSSTLQGGDARKIIKVEQALKKAHNSVSPSCIVTIPYASKSRGARWYEEQEESSRPHYLAGGGFEERVPSPARFVGRTFTSTPTPRYQKSQIRKLSQVMSTRELKPLVGPTLTFGPEDISPLQASHNDALVIQLRIATVTAHRMLVDTGSFVDVIMLECLKKLQYNEKNTWKLLRILLWGHVSPSNQKNTYPSRQQGQLMNRRNKLSSGRYSYSVQCHPGMTDPNAIKVVVASYLLLIQFKLDDEKVSKLYRDQKMARECYYMSLNPWEGNENPLQMSRPNNAGKKVVTKAMIVLLALTKDYERPHSEPTFKVVPVPFAQSEPFRSAKISIQR
ncbi:LOW QUALITY PROTEIN: hypothetical protein Cgig2_030315 [Carnegiea gigantea]|uniref:Uncharacterized protein n=1 Tax=Carnegiea gigantea TaxID=171969 RepID=A0A9Q1Q865_9CARY|nr:LOW QUALITY PROTEIN: hypothetical protein Cgig2_030315 [Carnegiea gigantea]